jgi:hypothetical protein
MNYKLHYYRILIPKVKRSLTKKNKRIYPLIEEQILKYRVGIT